MPSERILFVGHVFDRESMDDLRDAIKTACRRTDWKPLYADQNLVDGHILSAKIVPYMRGAELCLFEISDHTHPNVFIEYGYAKGMGKTCLLIFDKRKDVKPPSDLAGYDLIMYESFKELAKQLRKRLGEIASTSSASQPRLQIEAQIVNRADAFQGGIDYLKEKSRSEVIIYAPTGVWVPDKTKSQWFKTIAGCLAKAQGKKQPHAVMGVPTTLNNFVGVYGLPPIPRGARKNQFANALDKIEELFLPFNGLATAHIHFLRTDAKTVPGTGMIMIDDALALGFAVNGRYAVDYGIFIRDQHDITREVRKWFNNHVMAIVAKDVIQDMKLGKDMKQGIDDIREHHGLPRKHKT